MSLHQVTPLLINGYFAHFPCFPVKFPKRMAEMILNQFYSSHQLGASYFPLSHEPEELVFCELVETPWLLQPSANILYEM